jgi:7,8-dihydropterin-6-yl-methyl-4-(beta-D-ribofuranosyl)aminobenzene 5'-phosphate synthase
MKITIVYDNRSRKTGLKTGWGFSALVRNDREPSILFDTGDSGEALLHNMRQLDIDPRSIGQIVISHAHGDHTGGLHDILALNSHAVLYYPASAGLSISGRRVVPVSRPVRISAHVVSTGELGNIEQSLAIETEKGIVVVTGCSHPGVGRILRSAAGLGTIHGIIGGLHGFNEFRQLNGLELICPCHCTRHRKDLERGFPGSYIECGAGLELEFGAPATGHERQEP